MLDDETPVPLRRVRTLGEDLSTWSLAELEHYVAELDTEIERVRSVWDAKHGTRSLAEQLFKR